MDAVNMNDPYNFDGQIHTKGFHGALLPRDDLARAMKLVVWAAKCHTHARATRMPLGNLPHTEAEVNEAIEIVERKIGKPSSHHDEGVKVRSKRV